MVAVSWPGSGTIDVEWTLREHLPLRTDWLAPDELARMERQPPELGRAWAAVRCWVRERLALRLDAAPAALRIAEGPERRPALADDHPPAPFADFNISHTDAVAVLAISDGPVGVDIEVAPPDEDLVGLAAVVASPVELAELRCVPADRLRHTFHRWWVRKEAVLKGQGTGFLRDPRAVHVGTGDLADPPEPWVVTDLGALSAPGDPLLAVAHTASRTRPGGPTIRVSALDSGPPAV